MSSEYSTIQQHQPLRVPAGWDRQEKALIVQLDEVFDDIYRRFGRLRLEDMNKEFRQRIVDDEGKMAEIVIRYGEIEAAVSDMEGDIADFRIEIDEISAEVGDKYGQVSGITIQPVGIDISGSKHLNLNSGTELNIDSATLNIKANSELNIQSNGKLNIKGYGGIDVDSNGTINVKSGGNIDIKSGGTFTVASGNFGIDAQGNATFNGGGTFYGALSAATGTFAGDLRAAGGTFAGELTAATGTFVGELSAATGTFAGNLSAAGGTFKGELSAATGTFAGSLSAATGTFAGSLSAATGTFAGTLSASTVSAITLTGDQIVGGRLLLGGANNGNGQLQIQDANGVLIGYWNKDGIYAKSGTFEGSLNGATGTFSGNLSAAGGTFAGNLSAAGGTFAGTLSAVSGTFTTLKASDWTFDYTGAKYTRSNSYTMGIGDIYNSSFTNGGLYFSVPNESNGVQSQVQLVARDSAGLFTTKVLLECNRDISGNKSGAFYQSATSSGAAISLGKKNVPWYKSYLADIHGYISSLNIYPGSNDSGPRMSLYCLETSGRIEVTPQWTGGTVSAYLGTASSPWTNGYFTNLYASYVGGQYTRVQGVHSEYGTFYSGLTVYSSINAPGVQTSGQEAVVYSSNNNAVLQAGGYKLKMQSDGNLVIYNASGTAIWSTGTGEQ